MIGSLLPLPAISSGSAILPDIQLNSRLMSENSCIFVITIFIISYVPQSK
jgi:hypothetical protein